MARSEYVYVLMGADSAVPLAAFTVKRELRGMLIRIQGETPSVLTGARLFRMADGPGGFRAEMSVQDVIDGK